jgi:hypothetical protein
MVGEQLTVGFVYNVATYCTLDAQASINRRSWYVSSLTGVPCDEGDLAHNVSQAQAAPYKALLTDPAKYAGVVVTRDKRYGVSPFPADILSNLGNGVGTAGATPLPKQTSGLFSVYTPFQGKHFRGRMYVPFPDAADNTVDGIPTAGYLVRLGTLATVFITPLSFVGLGGGLCTIVCCLVSTGPPIRNPILTSFTVRPAWATQRKRGDYGKANKSPV